MDELDKALTTALEVHSAGTGVGDQAWASLLAAAERQGTLETAFRVVRLQKARGGSPNAEAVHSLLEWAVEVGDKDLAAWLEDELVKTGKAQYLAALSNPKC